MLKQTNFKEIKEDNQASMHIGPVGNASRYHERLNGLAVNVCGSQTAGGRNQGGIRL
jgi:hypothetical protein